MSNNPHASSSSGDTWRVESLRATGFPRKGTFPIDNEKVIDWWNELIGTELEEINFNRKEGVLRAKSEFNEGEIVLSIQASRIDWYYKIIDRPPTPTEPIPTIGVIGVVSPLFKKIIMNWLKLESCPNLRRLAFGAVLFKPANDRVDAYKKLGASLHSIEIDPDGSSDLSYQINRPRVTDTGISGLQINRLCKWSVGNLRLIAYDAVAGGINQLNAFDNYVCRLELDINSSAEYQEPMPEEELPSLFDEFVSLGIEITEKGDIK